MSWVNQASRLGLAQLQNAVVSSIVSGTALVSDELPLSTAESALYRRNVELMARNALAISFPTVASLLGRERFSHIARDLLLHYPPDTGDWGTWGRHLPVLLARSRFAGPFPFLVPAARLDWRMHRANRSADSVLRSESLSLLETVDLGDLLIDLADHCSLLSSRYPLLEMLELQQARGSETPLAERAHVPRRILVLRPRYRVDAVYLDENDYQFVLNLQRGRSIGEALESLSNQDFAFPAWIDFAIRNNLIYQFRQRL